MKFLPAQLESFCVEALLKVGVRESDARTTAEVLVTTDSWGVFTHGVKNLRGYLPGEMEWERRERALAEGMDLPEDVVANLRLLAEELNLDLNRFSK